jgi:hypothetical protein
MENDKTPSAVPTKEDLQAFIQARSYYYIPKWESFDPTLKRVAPGTFNWAACLLNVFWMAYRRMYLFVIILVAVEAVCFSILEFFFRLPTSVTNSVGIATMILLGRYGNSIYRKHVERKSPPPFPYQDAKSERDAVAALITPDQIAEGQRLSAKLASRLA